MFKHVALEEDFAHQKGFSETETAGHDLARLIDSTVLRPETTRTQIEKLCEEAATFRFRSVCVPPSYVSLASHTLKQLGVSSDVSVCTVVGFPNGYSTTQTKALETSIAVADGANEIDFVHNLGLVKDQNWELYSKECELICMAARGCLVKVILETSLLSETDIKNAAFYAARAGVSVIKTSTGFGSRGASLDDLKIIKAVLEAFELETGLVCGIKASGGIRSFDDALKFVKAGATRLGTSGGASLMHHKAITTHY